MYKRQAPSFTTFYKKQANGHDDKTSETEAFESIRCCSLACLLYTSMSKADLIAMLVSIREVARANGELKTVEHIDKILDEIRK